MAELSKLGRYQLRRVLGKGAMGVVYDGYDPTINRRVAVKVILKSQAIDEAMARDYSMRFVREAQAAGRISHPNIVQVYDFGEQEDIAYLVLEFIEGRDLRSIFDAKQAFETKESVRIMVELLDALDFAHAAGVIHRDVKPANVMLDSQRRVKLADFGVARIHDAERTGADTMVGTPAFMSPEQISGQKIDHRTDIFSAGSILYQLLTGEQPFKGEGAWTVAKKIMQDEPAPPSRLTVSVAPAFDQIVSKALAKEPAQRFASAREFANALRAIFGDQPQAQAPAAAPKLTTKPELQGSEVEIEFWRSIQNSDDPAELELYLEQFPRGPYAKLARHKVAKLHGTAPPTGVEDSGILARQAEEERARIATEEQARREAEEKSRRDAQGKVRAEAEAAELAEREARANAKRESEEMTRQALTLKQQTPAGTVADEGPTAAIATPPAAPSAHSIDRNRSLVIPAIVAVVVIAGGVAAYMTLGRSPDSKTEAANIDRATEQRIRKETEDRIRGEYTNKAAAEKAAADKAAPAKAALDNTAAIAPARQRPISPAVTPSTAPTSGVIVNGQIVSAKTLQYLQKIYPVPVVPGRYWYDPVSGAYGNEGGPIVGQMLPGLALGGPLRADASRGTSPVFINGRQITLAEKAYLEQTCRTVVAPGRYWVNAQGLGGIAGGPVSFNLALCAPPVRANSGSSSKTYCDPDGSCRSSGILGSILTSPN